MSWILVPDALGTIASILLAIPAWRAIDLMKGISKIEGGDVVPPPNLRDDRFVSHAEVSSEILSSMRGVLGKWNRMDELSVKIGMVVLVLSFVFRFFVSA